MNFTGFDRDLAVAVGRKLRAARHEAGLSAEEVASLCASHRPIISRTEHGHHLPKLPQLMLHASVVGLRLRDIGATVDKVMRRRGFVPPPPTALARRVSAMARRAA